MPDLENRLHIVLADLLSDDNLRLFPKVPSICSNKFIFPDSDSLMTENFVASLNVVRCRCLADMFDVTAAVAIVIE